MGVTKIPTAGMDRQEWLKLRKEGGMAETAQRGNRRLRRRGHLRAEPLCQPYECLPG